jgi:hypothetical protein
MPFYQANNANYGPGTTVSVGASPFSFVNPLPVPANVMISGGTVTTIEFSPDGVNFTLFGLLGGQVHLNPGQVCRVTYVVAPTMTYFPV